MSRQRSTLGLEALEPLSQRTTDSIRQVLLNVWDPLGIASDPAAQDRYDFCINDIHALLSGGATDDEIGSYLWRVMSDTMHGHTQRYAVGNTLRALREIPVNAKPRESCL
jgi:hypothetical protein